MNCYIEFDILEEKHFEDLQFVFNLIKQAKNNEEPKEDQFWIENFPDYSLKQFLFLENDIKPEFETASDGAFTWHFYSLIETLQINYEIEYVDCYKTSDVQGRLEYNPYSYPYGGITALITFIKSFHCCPTKINDGTSLYEICFLENGDFSITDLNDPKRQNSSEKLFNGFELLKKFASRFNR